VSYSPVTLGDILAEKQTDRRGTCSICEREGVPINPRGICVPCSFDPDWRKREAPESLTELIKRCFAAPKDRP
jgi:hypothetical protein